MSALVTSLLFGLGIGAWVYSQLAKRTGNASPTSNYIAAGFIAFLIALIFFVTLKFVIHIN